MSEVVQRDVTEARRIAHEMGLIAFFPHDTELFLDVDDNVASRDAEFARVVQCLESNDIAIVANLTTTSKNGGRHVYLILSEPLGFMERLVMQAAMQSDGVKEVLSMLRVRQGHNEMASCALFETEKEAGRVRAWRVENGLEPHGSPYDPDAEAAVSDGCEFDEDDIPY